MSPRCMVAVCAITAILSSGCRQTTSGISHEKAKQVGLDAPQCVARDLTLAPADYRDLTPDNCGMYVIQTDGVVLDCGGARLIGRESGTPRDRCVGRGIVVRDARNVTIRNARIEGFKVAIYAENAPGLTIEDCDVSRNYRQRLMSTPQREDHADWLRPHANDEDEWLRYGAGIYLRDCDDSRIIGNRARDGQNGICLSHCERVRVERNDMSYMSGWGLAMWRSSRCLARFNRFDYCVRGYSHGVYARGQDSAGILVFEQCCENIFAHNSATHCGDGFFLYAGHETLKKTGRGGCNGNILYQNNFSHSVAIGIEATFSRDNVFLENTISDCHYGIWAGYSRQTVVVGNTIDECTIGVAIEHGQQNSIAANRIDSCDTGVRLWWDKDTNLEPFAFCRLNDCASEQESIDANVIRRCTTGIAADQTSELSIRSNIIDHCDTAVEVEPDTILRNLEGNAINGGKLVNKSRQGLVGVRNDIGNTVELQGDITLNGPAEGEALAEQVARSAAKMIKQLRVTHALDTLGQCPPTLDLHNPSSPIHIRAIPCGYTPALPEHDGIFITEWGPFNHESDELCVLPDYVVSWDAATAYVLGHGEAFAMRVVKGDVVASALQDTTPSLITILPRNPDSAATPYAIDINVGGQSLRLNGVLLQAAWQVAYYVCPAELDPRKDDDWRQIIASPPAHSESRDQLQFNWGNRNPHAKVQVADRFGLVAETKMRLPDGSWRFRTISDDGVRVFLDGKRIINNWTWHVATEDTAIISLEAGEHTIRVEYFDLVGDAQLLFDLAPAGCDLAVPGTP